MTKTDKFLAALTTGDKRAIKQLEALAADYNGQQLLDIATASRRFPAARPIVARVAIPQLTQWIKWHELDPELVELCGFDNALLYALSGDDSAVRGEADKVFMRKADVATAKRFLALLSTKPFAQVRYRGVGLVFLTVLSKHRAPIPSKYDDLIYFDYEEHVAHQTKRLRLVVESIPMARRLKMLARGAKKDSGTRRMIFENFLDRAPKLARMALATSSDEAHHRRILGDLEGKRHPEIVAAVKKYALPALPPPPPKGVGPFSFAKREIINPSDYAKLTNVRKAQYRAAAGSYVGGGDVKNPRDFIAKLKRDELDEGDAQMRTWHVLRDGKHVFDLWVVWVDNGSFFHAGTPERAPVQIIQSSFLPLDKKPTSAELARLLDASEPKGGLW